MNAPYYQDDSVTVYAGDCLDVMAELADQSIDAVITDPPYGLEFMGKEWDRFDTAPRRIPETGGIEAPFAKHAVALTPARGREFQLWCQLWATECLRLLKPGGHLLAFGGTRTHHRLACAIEDAGFEIRDSIAWLYGSGFPKSLDVSKAIDRAAGVEREVVGEKLSPDGVPYSALHGPRSGRRAGIQGTVTQVPRSSELTTAPATDAAKQRHGWGTALKPSMEIVCVARKPLTGTVANNVQQYGTGAINVDACRVASGERPVMVRTTTVVAASSMSGESTGATSSGETTTAGRWPPNVAVDDATAAEIDKQSGITSEAQRIGHRNGKECGTYGAFQGQPEAVKAIGDSGGASRFFPTFRYEAKAPTSQRPIGNGVAHPTVKPLDLMRWLVRLVTPPNGLVLDPFAGSGTTAEAAIHEYKRCIVIEREADYLPLIVARLTKPLAIGFDFDAQ